jgi:hypothetical protein
MLRRVALVRTDVPEELSASSIRVTRIGELGTLAVTSNRRTLQRNTSVRRLLLRAGVVPSSQILVTLMKEALRSSGTSVLTRATRRNIPEDTILSLQLHTLSWNFTDNIDVWLSLPATMAVIVDNSIIQHKIVSDKSKHRTTDMYFGIGCMHPDLTIK